MPEYVREELRMLVIDDDAVSRLFVIEYLEGLGSCLASSNGAEGLALFAKALQDNQPFDLVCLDLELPDVFGIEVLKSMRDLEKQHQVEKELRARIVMTTSAGDMKNVLKAMKTGCDGYVVKPFQKEQLFKELNKVGLDVEWD